MNELGNIYVRKNRNGICSHFYRKTVDDNNDEALAFYYLEEMERQINEKAMSFMGDEQSFPYMLRLRESANGLKVP